MGKLFASYRSCSIEWAWRKIIFRKSSFIGFKGAPSFFLSNLMQSLLLFWNLLKWLKSFFSDWSLKFVSWWALSDLFSIRSESSFFFRSSRECFIAFFSRSSCNSKESTVCNLKSLSTLEKSKFPEKLVSRISIKII